MINIDPVETYYEPAGCQVSGDNEVFDNESPEEWRARQPIYIDSTAHLSAPQFVKEAW